MKHAIKPENVLQVYLVYFRHEAVDPVVLRDKFIQQKVRQYFDVLNLTRNKFENTSSSSLLRTLCSLQSLQCLYSEFSGPLPRQRGGGVMVQSIFF